MKSPFFRCCGAAALLVSLAALPGVSMADDITPPVVVKPISNLTVPAGTTQSVINLKKTFGLTGVTGPVVRMATSLKDSDGTAMNIDIELFSTDAPLNTANFLSYTNSGEYNKTFIHRLAANFVIQGGGYYIASSGSGYAAEPINVNAMVKGEHQRSNTRGTVALALSAGPDSGTSQWFINLVDNNGTSSSINLDDTSDGGPFTVFGRVIEGDMATADAINLLPVYDLRSDLGNDACNMVPVDAAANATSLSIDNLIYLNDVVVIPTIAPTAGADSLLTLKAKSNNTGLVTATVTGKKLKLSYVSGKTGTAKIKVLAKDSAGTQTKSQFTVTVQ